MKIGLSLSIAISHYPVDSMLDLTMLRTIATTAVTDPDLQRLIREAVGREITERLGERIGEPAGLARAAAFTSQVAGVIFARYLIRIEPIASMSIDDVA